MVVYKSMYIDIYTHKRTRIQMQKNVFEYHYVLLGVCF